MIIRFSRQIPKLFYILFFFVPIILWPYTSELFEFNKMVFIYGMTILITTAWLTKVIDAKKVLFRRTILDIPLAIFIVSQIASTLLSIDQRTSVFGYYSRFNGGLLSTICYSIIYWAYVSNMDYKKTINSIRFLFYSAIFVSIYAVLEHFGIDKSLWVQDVQNRVFSTLGQPNWLAAWLTAIIPITWVIAVNSKFQIPNSKQIQISKFKITGIMPYIASILFFITLLFTKSRSGLLGFVFADLFFWLFISFKHKKQFLKQGLIFNIIFLILFLVVRTPITYRKATSFAYNPSPITSNAPALETGGTESGTIRKIVWKGAIDVWKYYPLFGSGVETFAYSYYQFRPQEHNLVSEWDFLYNKAHNEYLNIAATTGTLGLLSYLVLIGFSVYQISKSQKLGQLEQLEIRSIGMALLAGYTSILVTNFFGFSVVPVQLQFFLFPAFAVAISQKGDRVEESKRKMDFSMTQKIGFVLLSAFTLLLFYSIGKYWYADIQFNKGKTLNDSENHLSSLTYLNRAIWLSPNEALFHNELARSYAGVALNLNDSQDKIIANDYANSSIIESNKAVALSPANLNVLKSRVSNYIKLSTLNPKFLGSAKDSLILALSKAPTDAKISFNLALIYTRTGETDEAVKTFDKTIELKPNYRDARFTYALLLIKNRETQKAKEQLNYILEKIDPNDTITKEQLNKI